jgi:hypothetical protein
MPYYLRTFSDNVDIFANIHRHILDSQSGALYNEPRLLLMEELREPRNYFSILSAIAQGRTRLNEIAQGSGVGEVNSVARYLDILQQMRLITRRVPATESHPEKSKKGMYKFEDHFLRFWFRYVHPNQSSLDLGLSNAILEQRIRPDLDHFVATAFEEAAQAYVAGLAKAGRLSFLPESIGGWWDRESEIDVLAISNTEKVALVGECKWSVNQIGINVLADLKEKSQMIKDKYSLHKVESVLFARSGYTKALQELASEEGISLYTVGQLVNQDEI